LKFELLKGHSPGGVISQGSSASPSSTAEISSTGTENVNILKKCPITKLNGIEGEKIFIFIQYTADISSTGTKNLTIFRVSL
jgi:hypothetical protein